jgi:hypothetical protein
MRQSEKVVSDAGHVGGQPMRPLARGGKHLSSPVSNGVEDSRRKQHAPILLSTISSFCPSLDATRVSNDWLRYASGSRASRTSMTTSALSRTAARCGRSGMRGGGTLLAPVVEAKPEVTVLLFTDLEALFVRPLSVPMLSRPPSESAPPSVPFVLAAAFCCAR